MPGMLPSGATMNLPTPLTPIGGQETETATSVALDALGADPVNRVASLEVKSLWQPEFGTGGGPGSGPLRSALGWPQSV